MKKILSFRWSRLVKASAWERLWCRWEYFLIGLILVGVASIWWWNNCWMFGIPVLLILAIYRVCTADGYCKIDNNRYYFYKDAYMYQMEVHDYKGCHTENVISWEYEKITNGKIALLYCDENRCWSMVSRYFPCIKLGTRINKASFVIEVPDIHGVLSKCIAILHKGEVYRYRVRKLYTGKNVRVCFTSHEKDALSEADLQAEYMVFQKENGVFCIWRVKNDAASFFASEQVEVGPSFIVRDDDRVSVWVWNYEVYRYREIFDDQVEALSVSGRFVKFKDGKGSLQAVISEFNPETKKVEQIYEGFVSSLDFNTGEYTV